MPTAALDRRPPPSASGRKCASCSAPIEFDPDSGGLKCGYCGAGKEIARANVARHPLAEAASLDRLPAGGTTILKCTQCGAKTTVADDVAATKCAFCASPLAPAGDTAVPPAEGVLPFEVSKTSAGEKFNQWLAGLWFRPSNLKRMARLGDLRGVYVPHWSFDVEAWSDWSAEAGYYYYVEEHYTENGERKTRSVQKTRWEPASGSHRGTYRDLLVHASVGLPIQEMGTLEPYQLASKLTAFDRDFLAGFEAEAHTIPALESWKIAAERIVGHERSECATLVPGDTHRSLHVSTTTSDEQARSVLLPVYVAAYEYGGRTYRIAVNGQTGRVVGKTPWSAVKITAFTLGVSALIALIYYLVQHHR